MIIFQISGTEECGPQEWQCTETKQCIPISKLCNESPDCPEGEDEGPTCSKLYSVYTVCLTLIEPLD
jgi:hypothetical protein